MRNSLIALLASFVALSAAELFAGSMITVTPASGYNLSWTGPTGSGPGSSGPFDNANPGHVNDAANPWSAIKDQALNSTGTTPFSSSTYANETVAPHQVSHINDGTYGNSNSWISSVASGGTDPTPFAGVDFTTSTAPHGIIISDFAFSRNESNPTFNDRSFDTYTIQYTQSPTSAQVEGGSQTYSGGVGTVHGSSLPTGTNPLLDWVTVGTVTYSSVGGPGTPNFAEYLRNDFSVSAANGQHFTATGFRIIVGNGQTDIDEIEVHGQATPEPSTFVLAGLGLVGLLIARRRRK